MWVWSILLSWNHLRVGAGEASTVPTYYFSYFPKLHFLHGVRRQLWLGAKFLLPGANLPVVGGPIFVLLLVTIL